MGLKEFTKELNGQRVEGELVKTMLYSLITSAVVFALLYFFRLRSIESFFPKYGFFLFFAILSYALIIPAVRQVRAYGQLPCMSGMMIGMTIGMISGFLSGFFIASTNGMFIGSVFGILIGISLGVWNGKCCGIMGTMEGTMAGFMGGLMGAMTAFMLFNDNLKASAVIVFVVSAFIMTSLNYMIYGETKESERQRREDHFWTIALSFVLTTATIWLM
jgi:hypothetical protein